MQMFGDLYCRTESLVSKLRGNKVAEPEIVAQILTNNTSRYSGGCFKAFKRTTSDYVSCTNASIFLFCLYFGIVACFLRKLVRRCKQQFFAARLGPV
jgi:hypothetical protein